MIIAFPKHKYAKCVHDGRCEPTCFVCQGLSFCETCKGAEGSLTSDCPGEPMIDEVEKKVLMGTIDYTVKLGWHETKKWTITR